MKRFLLSCAPWCLLPLLTLSCATLSQLDAKSPARATRDPTIVALRARLVEGADSLIGKQDLFVRGKHFTWDCVGTVLAIYWYAGVDLARDFDQYTGNGVARLYKSLAAENLIYAARYPFSGDLVFWDNTYDENGNGRWDDPLTHVGMVVSTAPDGEVSYVHQNVRRGIVVEYMNLNQPSVYQSPDPGSERIFNSPMREAQPGVAHPPNWLSGQLFRAFGMGYLF